VERESSEGGKRSVAGTARRRTGAVCCNSAAAFISTHASETPSCLFHIYTYVHLCVSITYLPVLRRALPYRDRFFCFFRSLFFSPFLSPLFLDATDARKHAIILIPSVVSNFDISLSSYRSGTFTIHADCQSDYLRDKNVRTYVLRIARNSYITRNFFILHYY